MGTQAGTLRIPSSKLGRGEQLRLDRQGLPRGPKDVAEGPLVLQEGSVILLRQYVTHSAIFFFSFERIVPEGLRTQRGLRWRMLSLPRGRQT